MVNLLGVKISHIRFGGGSVVEQNGEYIDIEFSDGIKKYQVPDAFEKFLSCEEAHLQKIILDLLAEKKEKAEELKKQKQEDQARLLNDRSGKSSDGKKPKTYPKANIAFKCNYCDGGCADNGIGFVSTCSDEMIKYNIDIAHHNWCCDDNSLCKMYHDGIVTRKELDEGSEDVDFVCYESQMLREWSAFAGYALTKENYQKPRKLNKVQLNSLAILTTREPYSSEKDRFVFGVFLVDNAYEGDNRDAGYVTTSSKYKLYLSKDEAKKVLFWNYYYNPNAPEKTVWGQGLHRYLNDEQAASILKDFAAIKKGKKDEKLAQELFEHFCKINHIEASDI